MAQSALQSQLATVAGNSTMGASFPPQTTAPHLSIMVSSLLALTELAKHHTGSCRTRGTHGGATMASFIWQSRKAMASLAWISTLNGWMCHLNTQRSQSAPTPTWTSPQMQWAGAGAPTTPSATVTGSALHGDYVSVKTTAMSRFLISAQSTNHRTRWDRVAAVPLLNARVIEPAVFGASAKALPTAD